MSNHTESNWYIYIYIGNPQLIFEITWKCVWRRCEFQHVLTCFNYVFAIVSNMFHQQSWRLTFQRSWASNKEGNLNWHIHRTSRIDIFWILNGFCMILPYVRHVKIILIVAYHVSRIWLPARWGWMQDGTDDCWSVQRCVAGHGICCNYWNPSSSQFQP